MYQSQAKGTILLLITALIWGAAFVAQSVGMDYIGPFTFSAARDVIAIVVLIPVILLFTDKRADGTYPPILHQLKPDRITLIGGAWCGLVLGAADTLQQVGISMTTAGKAGFITALYIILVPLLGRFMGRKVPRIIIACVALAIVGFYLLCINGDFQVSFGDFLVLCCAVFFALHILVIDHFLFKKGQQRQAVLGPVRHGLSLFRYADSPLRAARLVCPVGCQMAPALRRRPVQRRRLHLADRRPEIYRTDDGDPHHEPGISLRRPGRLAHPGRSHDGQRTDRLRPRLRRRHLSADSLAAHLFPTEES